MSLLPSLTIVILLSFPAYSQSMSGKWLVYEGRDGSELIVTLTPKGGGQAEFSLVRRMLAGSYGEGCQFWGTFRATGGYYFLVKGSKTVGVSISQSDSTFVVKQVGTPKLSVTAWLDEPYSTREISDYGDYKKQIVAQWKRDFPTNEDVKKGKRIMEDFFNEYFCDAFEVLLEGDYRISELSDSVIVLKKQDQYKQLVMIWKRITL